MVQRAVGSTVGPGSGSDYKLSPFESVDGVRRRAVVMNPFIFLLTHYWPKHSFYLNLESDYSN